ncbi:MAG TPA: reverse transcriptase family protein [Tepidisphaeraceae bacterium]|nr:reverse transcriptase family protein [Tepidisphaeraceae bacterium]
MPSSEKAILYHRITQLPPMVLLDRMRLHGFWPAGQGLPPDPPEESAERAKLTVELANLQPGGATPQEAEHLLAAERKRRWAESKKRRAERKQARLKAHQAWLDTWNAARAISITHLGEGVSGGLAFNLSDAPLLASRSLPVLHDAAQLAAAIRIPLATLRWLTYHRRGATLVHYHRYDVAKKTGKARSISAPKPALKGAQAWVLEHVLSRVPAEPQVHGFVPGRSIVSNAAPHVGRAVVINLDLKDFFPSITFRRVKGVFEALGYSEQVATVLALLCTEPPRVPAEVRGKRYHVALGERVLPQGASTSPAITNLLCRKLDKRLTGLAARLGFTYTRYADDLTFSSDDTSRINWLFRGVRMILKAEGLTEHADKTHVMRRSGRQEVTGVTVNARTTLGRDEARELRATLHNAAKHGLESQNREKRPNFAAYLRGRVAFASMVDPVRAPQWQSKLRAALGGAAST